MSRNKGIISVAKQQGRCFTAQLLLLVTYSPKSPRNSGLSGGLTEPDTDIRNGLVWYEGVEKAWSDLRICLEFHGGRQLRMGVLNQTLLDVCPVDLAIPSNRRYATDGLKAMTFRDLDKRDIYFPENVSMRPYQRVGVIQVANAVAAMKVGKLREDIDYFRMNVVSEFSGSRACSAWVKTTMVHIPHWPVGPEPEAELDAAVPLDIEDISGMHW